ncbi:phage tail tube protein [Erythrobacter sp. HA6-11]
MSGESIGWGGQFHLHNGSTLVAIERIDSLSPPEDIADEHEVTSLESPNRYKEYIPGMIDAGEITIEVWHVPNSTTDQLFRAAKAAADTRPWKIVYPAADGMPLREYNGQGFVRSYLTQPVTPNQPMKATAVIRVSGSYTEGAAS